MNASYTPVLVLLALAAVVGAALCARDVLAYRRAGRDWRQLPGQGQGRRGDGGGL